MTNFVDAQRLSEIVNRKFGQLSATTGAKQTQMTELDAQTRAALSGSPEQQQQVIAAQRAGQAPGLDEFESLSTEAIVQRFGVAAARARGNLFEANVEFDRVQNAPSTRTLRETASDTALSVGQGITNVGASALAAGATVYDELVLDPINEVANLLGLEGLGSSVNTVARGHEAVNQGLQELKSPKLNAAAEQAQITAAIDTEAREDLPWLDRQIQGVADTIDRYIDNPALLADASVQSIGSFIPFAAAARALGMSATISQLSQKGLSQQAIQQTLRTAAGRQLVIQNAARTVPGITSATEGGSGALQASQAVQAMSHEELLRSQEYRNLIDGGMSPEAAKERIAGDAAASAATVNAVIGFATSFLNRGFEANPLNNIAGQGIRQAAGKAVTNTVSESAEEFLQEAGNQLSTDIGLVGVDLEDAENIGQDIGAAGAEGLVAAGPMTAALSVPSIARGAAVDTIQGVSNSVNRRLQNVEAQRDAADPVGSTAQARATQELNQAREQVPTALDLDDSELADFQNAGLIPEDVQNASRADVVTSLGEQIKAPEDVVPGPLKDLFSVEMLRNVDLVRRAGSDEARSAENAGPIQEALTTIESNPVIETAKGRIQEFTPEYVEQIFDLPNFASGNMDAAQAEGVAKGLEVVSRYNKGAVDSRMLSRALEVLEQTDPESTQTKNLRTQSVTAHSYERADAQQAAIQEDLFQEDGQDPTPETREKIYTDVSNQIRNGGFVTEGGNARKGLVQHESDFIENITAERYQEAFNGLEDIKGFFKSQNNKIEALNRSIETGQPQVYEAFDGTRMYTEDRRPLLARVGNRESMLLAQQIVADTQLIGRLYNTLVENYGEQLNIEDIDGALIKPTPLDGRIEQSMHQLQIADNLRIKVRQDAPLRATRAQQGPGPLFEGQGDLQSAGLEGGSTPETEFAPNDILTLINDFKPLSKKEYRALRAQAGGEKPFAYFMRELGGINTGGELYRELRAMGITSKDFPGLFKKKGGIRNADEIVTGEHPGFADFIGDDGAGYATTDGIVEALSDETGGSPRPATFDQNDALDAVLQEDEQRDYIDRLRNDEQFRASENERLFGEQTDGSVDAGTQNEEAQEVTSQGQSQEETGTEAQPVESQTTVEPDPAPVSEPSAPVGDTRTAADAFSGLTEGSRLLGSFNQVGSEIYSAADPVAEVVDQLDISPDQADLISGFFQEFQATAANVNDYVQDLYNSKKSAGLEKILNTYRNLRSLHLAEIDGDTVKINDTVMQAASMAVYQWILNTKHQKKIQRKPKNMAKIFGINEGQLTKEHVAVIDAGENLQSVLDHMSKSMISILGLKPKMGEPVAFTQGIFRGFASDIIETMVQEGTLINEVVEVPGTEKTFNAIRVAENPEMTRFQSSLTSQMDPFTAHYAPQDGKLIYAGENALGELPPVQSSVRGQNSNRLSGPQVQAVKRLRDMPFFLVPDMLRVMDSMSESAFMRLMGAKDIPEPGQMNEISRLSAEGTNLSIQSQMDGIRAYRERLNDSPVTPVYFDWNISRVGRLHQKGLTPPQNNKIVRQLLSATKTKIDITSESQELALLTAIAQGFDDGSVKVDQHPVDTIKAAVIELLENKYREPLAAMTQILGGSSLPEHELFEAMQNSGMKITPEAVNALIHGARYIELLNTEGGSKTLPVTISLELDGVTDGPINAAVNMGTGPFRTQIVKALAKGGVYLGIGKSPTSRNDWSQFDSTDLYNEASVRFESKIRSIISQAAPAELETFEKVLRILDALVEPFEYDSSVPDDEDGLNVKRNFVKNPLTVFIYGSSVKGIADKIAGEIIGGSSYSKGTSLYDQMNTLLDGGIPFSGEAESARQLARDLNSLVPGILDEMRDPQNANFSRFHSQISALIEATIAEPLVEAIDETTGGLRTNMQVLQSVSQIQAMIFVDTYNKILKEKGLSDQNSLQDFQDAFDEASRVAPIYMSDIQEFHVASAESYDSTIKVSENFNGRMSSGSTIPMPSEASVKVSPYLVIGTGDGAMIMNIYTGQSQSARELTEGSLAVFDGVEIPVNNIEAASRYVNERVWDGYKDARIAGMVADSFRNTRQVMDQDSSAYSPETKVEIRKTMAKLNKMGVPVKGLGDLQNFLDNMADENEARKWAMDQMHISVDHMASAGAPYVKDGIVAGNGELNEFTIKDSVDILNQLYNKRLNEIRKEKGPKIQSASKKFMGELSGVSEETGYGNSRAINASHLLDLLDATDETTSVQNETIKAIKDHSTTRRILNEYTFVVGSPEDLTRMRDTEYQGYGDGRRIQKGQILPGARVAFITSGSPETLLHEIMHAVTADRLHDYYADEADGAVIPKYVKDAVKRLEAVRDDLLERTIGEGDDLINIVSSLQSDGVRGNPAIQIGELIAWGLTNQVSGEALGKVKAVSPVFKLANKVVKFLQQLLGIRQQPVRNLLDQLRFDAQVVLIDEFSTYAPGSNAVGNALLTLEHKSSADSTPGKGPHKLEERYLRRLEAFLRRTKNEGEQSHSREMDLVLARANSVAEAVKRFGFSLGEREADLFKAMVGTLNTVFDLNPAALRQAKRIYAKALEEAPDTLQWRFLSGSTGFKGADDRTGMLPIFVALSQIDPDLKKFLSTLDAPALGNLANNNTPTNPEATHIDRALEHVAGNAVDYMTRLSIEGLRNRGSIGKDALTQMNNLAYVLGEITQDRALKAEVLASSTGDKVNDYVSGLIEKGSEKAFTAIGEFRDKNLQGKSRATKTARALATVAQTVTGFANAGIADQQVKGLASFMNRHPGYKEIRALMNDFRGITDDNAGLLRLLNQVRYKIDALRQDFREKVPSILAGKFSERLTADQWSSMKVSLLDSDLVSLGHERAMQILNGTLNAQQEISVLEDQILAKAGTRRGAQMISKAGVLAEFMMTRENRSKSILRNAYAIAKLAGEKDMTQGRPDDALVQDIDELVSLYAYELTNQNQKDLMTRLAQNETEGMDYVVGYAATVRGLAEAHKNSTADPEMAEINGWKGHSPQSIREGQRIIVAPDSENANLVRKGYVRLKQYRGNANDPDRKDQRSYYVSTVGGKAAFRQGTGQTVHGTFNGVNPRTGRSEESINGEAVTGRVVRDIARDNRDNPNDQTQGRTSENLQPVFDPEGHVISFERGLDPDVMKDLDLDNHIGRVLGVWSGRMVEEDLARNYNKQLIQNLKKQYDQDKRAGKLNEYVNIAGDADGDPILKDAWSVMGQTFKDDAFEVFGREKFMPVRRDQVLDAFGQRQFSVRELWSDSPEQTKARKQFNKAVQDTMTLFAGTKGYKLMVQGEDLVQDLVSYAKTTIVVRSLRVMWGNVVSNNLHLMMWGLGPVEALRVQKDKFLETQQFVNNQDKIIELTVQLSTKGNDRVASERIRAQIKSLEDLNNSMSITPLLQAGEFNTISESLTEADVAIREGRLSDYLEAAAEKLPAGARDVFKTALITKDSALFRGLNRAVQYGDFVAKAALYDHLMDKKGYTQEEALRVITEEFVNYNRLGGRGREYLESMGLMWFYNYKLRIMKIMAKMARDRPVTAMIYGSGVAPLLGIDTVFSSSLLGGYARGTLGFSIGPEMGLQAWQLNPWLASVR